MRIITHVTNYTVRPYTTSPLPLNVTCNDLVAL